MPINSLQGIRKSPPKPLRGKFENIAQKISGIVGTPYWFFFSVAVILIWLPTGFFMGFGELWHLHINTVTTIFTFLMMSLLHASQRRWEKRIEDRLKKERSDVKNIREDTEKISRMVPNSK